MQRPIGAYGSKARSLGLNDSAKDEKDKDMAEITAALVKELREISGAGMMDCKKALVETSGNLDEASDWLRKKGLAAAAKKAGRVAAEGLGWRGRRGYARSGWSK